MKNFVVWCETVEDVRIFIDWTLQYTDGKVQQWMTQYLNEKSPIVPAYIGWRGSYNNSSHQPVHTKEHNIIYNHPEHFLTTRKSIRAAFYEDYTDIPIEAIKNPKEYPEYFI